MATEYIVWIAIEQCETDGDDFDPIESVGEPRPSGAIPDGTPGTPPRRIPARTRRDRQRAAACAPDQAFKRKEANFMTIFYVTVESCQGVIAEIHAFLRQESAEAAERNWIETMGIKDANHRQAKAESGTECRVFEAELKP